MIMTRYELDNGMGRGSFYAVLALYRRQAYIVIAVGLGFGLFSGWVHYDAAAILLILSAILAWLFMTWMTIVYEKYLHSKYPKNVPIHHGPRGTIMVSDASDTVQEYVGPTNYTWIRYAATNFIAFFTVLTFVAGLIIMLFSLLEH